VNETLFIDKGFHFHFELLYLLDTHSPNVFGALNIRELEVNGIFWFLTFYAEKPFVIDYVCNILPPEK